MATSHRQRRRDRRLRTLALERLETRTLLATFVVNSTGNGVDATPGNGICATTGTIGGQPECTLRAAIQEANATANSPAGTPDRIHFNIAGAGVRTIQPLNALPNITQAVVIDGFTQPSSGPNTQPFGQGLNAALRIELNGQSAGAVDGLRLAAGSDGSTIRGLAINRFVESGILIDSSNNRIGGNYLGTSSSGASDLGNDIGVHVRAPGNFIGGTAADQRNLISGNGFGAIVLESNQNIVQGNLIGTSATGMAEIPNVSGINVASSDNQIGGTAVGEGNVIAASDQDGILVVLGVRNVIEGNYIGVGVDGDRPMGNFVGVRLFNARETTIGGTATTAGNIIAHNFVGIDVNDASVGNAILGNSIHSNFQLGIDLAPAGPNGAIDNGDGDSGANGQQNFPTISSAAADGAGLRVLGELSSKPNANYRLEFFSSESADETFFGEGQTFLGAMEVQTNAQGRVNYDALVALMPEGQDFITATATDLATNDTSEFGLFHLALMVSCSTVVTTTAPAGAGSLRGAIECSNSRSGAQNVTFALPATDPGHVYYRDDGVAGRVSPNRVTPTTAATDAAILDIDPDWPHSWFTFHFDAPLPDITDPVVIDGYSQTGALENLSTTGLNSVLRIELEGTGMDPDDEHLALLNVASSDVAVLGLVVNRVKADFGVAVTGGSRSALEGNYFGTDVSGSVAFAAQDWGRNRGTLLISSAPETQVGGFQTQSRNLISGNSYSFGTGLSIRGNSSPAFVFGNLIGTNRAGTAALPNAWAGIDILSDGPHFIGGDGDLFNVISGNALNGVFIGADLVSLVNNRIGTDITGTLPVGNGGDGVRLEVDAADARILRNLIAFNKSGVFMTQSVGQGNLISQNSIHSHEWLGIDFNDSGQYGPFHSTPNDVPPEFVPPDSDTGPNAQQNFPVLTAVIDEGTQTRVLGTLTSVPNSTFRIEFFVNQNRGTENYGEGEIYVGMVDVTTDSTGRAAIEALLPPFSLGTPFYAATATDITVRFPATMPANNTSEFSEIASIAGLTCSTVVISTAEDGLGSLRAALACADVLPGVQTISFDIPAGDAQHQYYQDDGVAGQVSRSHVATTTAADDTAIADIDPDWPHSWFSIELLSNLPQIVEPVVINGYSQPGSRTNTLPARQGLNTVLKIEINAAEIDGSALYFGIGDGTNAGGSTIRGLVVNNAPDAGIVLDTFGGNRVTGNFVGTDVSGTLALGNRLGVDLFWEMSNRIGGDLPAERNLISGNDEVGLWLNGGTYDQLIVGNLIGVDRTRTRLLPNDVAIYISGDNEPGETEPSERAAIFRDLVVGYDSSRNTAISGLDFHSLFQSNMSFVVQRTEYMVEGLPSGSESVIDLAPFGFNENDGDNPLTPQIDPDSDTGINGLLNFPDLELATPLATGTTISGTLTSLVNSTFSLEFYSTTLDTTKVRGGERYLGSLEVTTSASGQASFSFTTPIVVPAGEQIVATSTRLIDHDGLSFTPLVPVETSEFSAGVVVAGIVAPTDITLSRQTIFGLLAAAWIAEVTVADATPGDTHTFTISDARFEVRDGHLYLKAGRSVNQAVEPTVTFTITVRDASNETYVEQFTFNVMAPPSTWACAHQWGPKPHDVNVDGSVTPLDAILIINQLNSGPKTLTLVPVGTAPPPFMDVSCDDVISALDIVLVVNFLNAGGSGESEPALAAPIGVLNSPGEAIAAPHRARWAAESISSPESPDPAPHNAPEAERMAAVDAAFATLPRPGIWLWQRQWFDLDSGGVVDTPKRRPRSDAWTSALALWLKDNNNDEWL